MVVDTLKIWDLSSDVPYRPTVSNPSPSHSSSPSKSLPASGLEQEVNEIFTPVINNIMSPPATPRNYELLSISSGTEFRFTNVKRRPSLPRSQESLLSEFIQWDRYRQSNERLPCSDPARSLLSRHSSMKRTDFTSKLELKNQARKSRFLFHKGFFKRFTAYRRTSRRISTRNKRPRSRADFDASMKYTSLRSFHPEDIVSSRRVLFYRPRSIIRRCPGVKIASEVPIKNYVADLNNEKSIRRPRIRKVSAFNVERSNTCPAAVRNIRRRSYSPETRAIQNLWKEYLSLVIAQRIELRMSLSRCEYGAVDGALTKACSLYANSTKSSTVSSDRRLSSLRINC